MTNNTQSQIMPKNRFIELAEVTNVTTLKKTAIYELIKIGEINPIKLGRKTVFSEFEIQCWIAARIADHCKSVGAI